MKKINLFIIGVLYIFIFTNASAQWTAKANFTNSRVGAAYFTIGTKAYAGLGVASFNPITQPVDWWQYDPATNVWTQKANFAGGAKTESSSFSIGTKGYVCLGYSYSSTVFYNDLWEYDATANTWTAKANFTGTARRGCPSFVAGTNAYVGTGDAITSGYQSDFYKYSQTTNTWSAIASYPLTCAYSGSFSDGTNGYLVGGSLNSGPTTAMYQYNPTANTWTAKASYTGNGRYDFATFYLNGKGYTGCGYNGNIPASDFRMYDPSSNTWSITASLPAAVRSSTISFAIGNKGYCGLGLSGTVLFNDFWEFTPCTTPASITSGGGTVICGSIILSANTGAGLTYQWYLNNNPISGATSSTYSAVSAGSYFCLVYLNNCPVASNTISLTTNNPIVGINYAGSWYLCNGNTAVLPATISGGGGTSPTYQWTLNGTNINGATSSTYTATQSGLYNVKVTNPQTGCYAFSGNAINLTFYTSLPSATISYSTGSSGCSNVPMIVTSSNTLGYQWRVNGNNISGATASSYAAITNGVYDCAVTNSCGTTYTNQLIPSITGTGNITVSGSTTLCSGSVTLTAPFFAGAVYQWYNSSNPIEGANSYTYPATGAGQYNCLIITTSCSTMYSANTITVDGAPTITNVTPLTFCVGGVAFVANTNNTGLSYQWKLNGVNISGANTSSFSYSSAGNYTCEVNNSLCGTVTSNALNAISNSLPALSLLAPVASLGNTDVCSPPGSIDMLALPGNTGYNYDLYNNISAFSIFSQQSNFIQTPGTGFYHIEMTNSCGTAVSNTVNIRNATYPLMVYADGPATFCSTNPTALHLIPNNGWPYTPGMMGPDWDTYQWKLNGVNLPAPNGTYVTYGPLQTGWYNCTVTNSCGAAQYVDSLYITVTQGPVATSTPTGSVSICLGGSILLNANTGAGLTYQWMKGNNNISGATSSTYSATSAGNYFVVVTNSSGCSATSAAVVVTVGTGATATITPTGTVIVCAGSATTLSANTGAGITYQWYRNSAAISGATSSTYAASSSGTYYVTESSTCGNATSNSVIVNSINNPVPAISYTTPLAFCSPGSVLLTANTFSGVGFQWQKNSVDIVGATSQTYSATSNGAYRVKETANGCYKYAPAVSTTTATTVTAAITASGPTTFCTGGSVILSVTNAISGYSYQWKKNNTNISGAILSSYTATTAGSYTCYISATCGNATSNTITVSTGGITALVNPAGSVTICSGATVAFSANTGTGYTYQWKLNGSNISGATLSSYTATTVGNYTVAIASPCGNATSTATTVSVSNVTATVTPSGTTTICAGGATTFTANTGYNFAYQWYRNTGAIGGATNATYGASSNGNYTVKITQGGVCSATSSISILVVTNNPTPSITAGGPTTFCAGQSVTLTANTFAGVIYEWQKNSAAISGATAQTYVATTAGAYRVKETANGCAKYAVALSVVVNCRVMGGQGHWAGAGESENKIVLSPNPTNGKLKLETGNLNGGEIKIRVLDVLGKEVFSTQFTNSDETNVHEMDLSNLINGIYFLQVNTDRGSVVKKFIKQ